MGQGAIWCLAALSGDTYRLHRLHVGLHVDVDDAVLVLLVGPATERRLLFPCVLDLAKVDILLQ
eukprot:4567113-Pyramimonas_sp.AAC.1